MGKSNKKPDDKGPSQNRKWLITINNPVEHGFTHDKIKEALSKVKGQLYWCMCDEIGGKEKTYHTHLFIYRPSPFKFEQIKKMFPPAHLDSCFGTNQDNRDYIRKEGKYKDSEKGLTNLKDSFEESGECPIEEQGKRNDLTALYQMIKDGLSDYDILECNPDYIDKLDKISKVRETLRYESQRGKRRLDLTVEYWCGCSGSGKTRTLMDRYGDENVYRVTDPRHPWDMYKGQDVVVFEEFYSENFSLPEMLNWLDVYFVELPCRYNNKVACFTKVFLTSNRELDSQYKYLQQFDKESWKAFLRRISCIKIFDSKGHMQEYKTLEQSKDRFIEIPDDLTLPFT